MRHLGSQVADLVRIGSRVVQLLGRPAGSHPQRRRAGQRSFSLQPEPLLHDGALIAVDDVARVRQLGREVADVEEALIARRAHHVVFDVHPIARAEHEPGRRRRFRSDEHAPLKMRGNLDARHRKNGRREIDHADELIADAGSNGRTHLGAIGSSAGRAGPSRRAIASSAARRRRDRSSRRRWCCRRGRPPRAAAESRRPGRPCRRCCRTCARAPRARAACRDSTAER